MDRSEFLKLAGAAGLGAALGLHFRGSEAEGVNGIFPGIRYFPGLGMRRYPLEWEGFGPKFADDLYNTYGAPREAQWFYRDRLPRYWFYAGKKYQWRDLVVDENVRPTLEQARDPNWSGYRWNQHDYIDDMLQAECIQSGRAKLTILLAVNSSSTKDPAPQWLTRAGLTWEETQHVHVRWDKQEAVEHTAAFLEAFVKKFGGSKRIAHIAIGEYWPSENKPAGFDLDAFRSNVKVIWDRMLAAAPRDIRGNRMNIIQVNPMFQGGNVTHEDLATRMIGLSGADPQLFRTGCGEPGDILCDSRSTDRGRQELYGRVPIHHQTGAGVFQREERQRWSGIENPWGYRAGESVPIRLEHFLWYSGSQGVIPTNALEVTEAASLRDQYFSAFDQFGPGGSRTAQWGQIPHYPPGG